MATDKWVPGCYTHDCAGTRLLDPLSAPRESERHLSPLRPSAPPRRKTIGPTDLRPRHAVRKVPGHLHEHHPRHQHEERHPLLHAHRPAQHQHAEQCRGQDPRTEWTSARPRSPKSAAFVCKTCLGSVLHCACKQHSHIPDMPASSSPL